MSPGTEHDAAGASSGTGASSWTGASSGPGASSGAAAGAGAKAGSGAGSNSPGRTTPGRKSVLLRLNEPVYDAIARWARDDLRSVNAQIEYLLRRSLETAGRAPTNPGAMPRRGRPPGKAPK
ncbi:MAG: hypothetical protein LBJ02_09015 [Bifidobacteriaceae bacterium]|jgi:hypothetical protein|nr:hypothetical protein [Bifidobacteriaceae bacterium]